ICETPDFAFPMQADVYHPVVEQGTYGNIKKTWVLDRTIACSFTAAGSAFKEEVIPNVNITQDKLLVGRCRTDVRISSIDAKNSITNVIITNIKDKNCNEIYIETSGPRAGKSTIFEIAKQEPFVGPFGGIEYYSLVIRRSENQAVDV
ncbi:MAG: hypothetical protein EB127_21770, partial [Alphaproteobacteria bacterium]|nr:hypothetical protein [Alphaproteobacteria bacterium]